MSQSAAHAFSAQAPPAPRVLFARQAILDVRGRLAGYELLYRGLRDENGLVPDAESATCQVLAGAFAEVGLAAAVGGAPAWVNVSERFVRDFDPLPLPAAQTVLELLEDHVPSAELLDRLRQLRTEGYRIALDDFVLTHGNVAMLEIADVIKVDLRAGDRAEVEPMVRALAARGLTVLAEKVEDQHERDWSAAAGATLFQGFFFCRPVEIRGEEMRAASLARLRAAAGLADPEAGLEEIEYALRTDPELSLRLLRYLNSAALSLPHRISSVKHAMMLLGPRTVRQWALVLLMSGIGEQRGPLLPTALIRARTAELVAHAMGLGQPDAFFSVGLLSVSDALAGRPLEQVLAELPLDDAVVAALLHHAGPMGQALAGAKACERGELPAADSGLVLACYADAVAWTEAQGLA